jgi:hypothetical protein
MGNELPDLWWLMSPEFIQHAIKELNLKGDNEPHYLVLERYIDDLVNRGYLKDARNGRRHSGSPKFDGSPTFVADTVCNNCC